jgi:DNA-binding response OmpR family regulator
LQEVWGYNSRLTAHTLKTHIYRLRQKIEKDAAAPTILVTEAGGYKLVQRSERPQPLTQRIGVGGVDQEVV